MVIYQPYFYIIEDVRNGMYYAGAKWGKDANPETFMIDGGYCTSSEIVKELIRLHGLENFIVRKMRVFDSAEDVQDYETRFLQKVEARSNPRFYNGHNNDGAMDPIKMKIVMMELYGVDNALKSKTIREKSKLIMMNRYGVEHPMHSDIIKNKLKNTNIERYGVEYPNQNEHVMKKRKDTNIEKYNVEHSFQSEIVKEKIRCVNREKLGVDYPTQNEIVKKKILDKRKIKYNRIQIFTIKKYQEKYRFSLGKGWYQMSDEKLNNIIKELERKFGYIDSITSLSHP